MSFFAGLAEIATGGLGKTIIDTIKEYFPPEMTAEQRANISLAATQLELQKAREFSDAQHRAEEALNARIAMYEGTAADLKGIPLLGALMLFARGSQRPVWGFATMLLDYQVFSGAWKLEGDIITNAFWIVNFLVLGFLFGERAVTNVMPFITNMIQARNPK
jgi:hypothetical protein